MGIELYLKTQEKFAELLQNIHCGNGEAIEVVVSGFAGARAKLKWMQQLLGFYHPHGGKDEVMVWDSVLNMRNNLDRAYKWAKFLTVLNCVRCLVCCRL